MSHFAETKGAFYLPDLDEAAFPTRCSKSEHFARTILSQALRNGVMGKWLSLACTMGRKKPNFCDSFPESQQ
jgi:hypothetical protein